MHDVVAVALITGGSGVAGSTATYFATRRQADRQAATERERIQAELDRLKLEQEEPHVQHRQVVYHELLDILARWYRAYRGGDIATIPLQTRWLEESETKFNAVSLFASRPVAETLGPLKAALEAGIDAGASDFSNSHLDAEFISAYNQTISAMRKDTAPD